MNAIGEERFGRRLGVKKNAFFREKSLKPTANATGSVDGFRGFRVACVLTLAGRRGSARASLPVFRRFPSAERARAPRRSAF